MVLVSSSVVSLGPFFYISSSDRSRDGRAILREQVVLLLIRVRICSVPRLRGEDVSMSILLQAKNSYSIGKKIQTFECFLGKKTGRNLMRIFHNTFSLSERIASFVRG